MTTTHLVHDVDDYPRAAILCGSKSNSLQITIDNCLAALQDARSIQAIQDIQGPDRMRPHIGLIRDAGRLRFVLGWIRPASALLGITFSALPSNLSRLIASGIFPVPDTFYPER